MEQQTRSKLGKEYDKSVYRCPLIWLLCRVQRRKWQHTPVFLPGKSQGQKSLVNHSQWDHKQLDTTYWINSTNKNNAEYFDFFFFFFLCVWICKTICWFEWNLYANFKYKFLDFSSSPRFWLTKLIIKTNSANKKI